MLKKENDWSIESKLHKVDKEYGADFEQFVNINGEEYCVSPSIACLAHSILLLVDAIKEI